MLFKYIKDLSMFLLLFVSFNNTFSTEIFGGFIIKAALGLFIVVHLKDYFYILATRKYSHIKAFLVFFFVLTVLTMITSMVHLDDTLTDGFIKLFAMFALFIYFSHTPELDKVLYMLWAIMIVSSVIAYFADPMTIYTFRRSGGTGDPNDFAAQLLVVMFTTVYLFQKNKNWFFLLFSLAFFTYSLLFAGSKSAFIFLALMLMITLITRFKTLMMYLFSLKGLLATVVLVVALTVGVMQSGKAVEGLQGRAKESGTFQQRLIVWSAGIEMIRDHFFMGVGFNKFPEISKDYVKDFLAEEARPSHNIFIKIFAESGVFAFLAFLFFLMMLFGRKLRVLLYSEYYWLYLASLSVILMGMTIPSLYHKDLWISLAILSNVLVILFRQEELTQEEIGV